jgi:hypothetical protein
MATPVKTGKIAVVPHGVRFVESTPRQGSFAASTFADLEATFHAQRLFGVGVPAEAAGGSPVDGGFPTMESDAANKRLRIQAASGAASNAANSTILQRRIDKRVKQRKRRAQRASRKRKQALDMLDLSLQLAAKLTLPKSDPA